jgi:hypothetical protein
VGMSNASHGTGWRLRTTGRQQRGFGVRLPAGNGALNPDLIGSLRTTALAEACA